MTYDEPDVVSIRESEKAILVIRHGKEVWVPKSVIDDDSEVYEADQEGTLIVGMWWAEEQDWI